MPNGWLIGLTIAAMCVTSFLLGCIPSIKLVRKEVGTVTVYKSPNTDDVLICKLTVTPETLNDARIILGSDHVSLKVIDRSNEYYYDD